MTTDVSKGESREFIIVLRSKAQRSETEMRWGFGGLGQHRRTKRFADICAALSLLVSYFYGFFHHPPTGT
jgi:hypothetical protein